MIFNDAFVDQLLHSVESETLDFKQSQYDFSSEEPQEQKRKRAEFVKDILAMYNTPREHASHIVLGIKKELDNTFSVVGVKSHYDQSELQAKFNDWVYPTPTFTYNPLKYREIDIAIIEIPPVTIAGPCVPLKDLPSSEKQTLRQHQIYIRKGPDNQPANGDDQKRVHGWFRGDPSVSSRNREPDGPWDEFLEEVHSFSPDFYFGLVVSSLGSDPEQLTKSWAGINWAFVLDFDRRTDIDGFLARSRSVIELRRTVHVVTKGHAPTLNIDRGTYWYCANGLDGRSDTIPKSDRHADWNRMYGVELQGFVGRLAAVTTARPVVLVVLWTSDANLDALKVLLTTIHAAFANTMRGVVITEHQSNEVDKFCDLFDCKRFVLPIRQLSLGISHLISSPAISSTSESLLPSTSGAPLPIPTNRLAWLSEELQILHLNEGKNADALTGEIGAFLRGSEISWYELGLHYDVARDITERITKKIRSNLGSHRTLRVNLHHAPGAGGTTVARRVMWELRSDFPCMLLLRTMPKETCERLAYIASLTGKSMLLVADAGVITDREADALYEVIAAAHLPVVLLQVNRRYSAPLNAKGGWYIGPNLESHEASRFVHFLQRERPDRAIALSDVVRDASAGTLTPFYLALVAYGRDFTRLTDYVSRRLEGLAEAQKRCLAFLAIAHYYAQRPVPAQMFAEEMSLPASRPVDVSRLLPPGAIELLTESRPKLWRTVHPLVAEECMRQICSATAADPDVWNQQLSSWSKRFIDFCRGSAPVAGDEGLDLARRVFVFRDNSEVIGSERAGQAFYSEALEQIPSPEGRLEVLRHLTSCFPEEPHFWAHLGRFLSNTLREHKGAEDAVEHAIALQPRDHVLHHMKGMVLRNQLDDLIAQKSPLVEVISQAELASAAFLRAREIEPDDEPGYIAEAQMSLKVLDYCGVLQRSVAIHEASSPASPKWVREAFQAVEELLSQVRHNREGERASRREDECRAALDALYGDYSNALQRWDSMLSRPDVFRPPIRRQIVWAYLSRSGRKWNSLSKQEIERSVRLLSENLDEEPNNEKNLRLWLQAVRAAESPPHIDTVIEKLGYWRANSDSLEPVYYLFVMYCLKAFEGSSLARDMAKRTLEECRVKARYRRNRSKSFEWLGLGTGLRRLIHQDSLGEWDRDQQYWSDPQLLARVTGVVRRIQGPESGEIETESGLIAFYVPARAGHYKGGDSDSRRVTCHIGFSYDGIRAWSVHNKDSST